MKTTILMLIAAAGLVTGCRSEEKKQDQYQVSDHPPSTYYPADRTTTTVQTTTTTGTGMGTGTAAAGTGTTVWHSSRDGMVQQTPTAQDQSMLDRSMDRERAKERLAGMNEQDKEFVKETVVLWQTEGELGQLAARQGSDDRVKQFGQRIVDDHARVNEELTTLATSKNIDTSKRRDRADRQKIDRLSQVNGADFDRQFLDQTIRDHQEAIDLFDRQSRTGQDPQLKAFAARNLPTLRSHLQTAKDLKIAIESPAIEPARRTPTTTTPSQPVYPNQPRSPSAPDPLNPSSPNNPINPNNPTPNNPSNPVDPNAPR